MMKGLYFIVVLLLSLYLFAFKASALTKEESIDFSCPNGTISGSLESNCTECPKGTYSNDNHTQCLPCNKGTYCSDFGCSFCSPCFSGTVARFQGLESCENCIAGFIPNDDHTDCIPCPSGLYSLPGDSVCKSCDLGYIAQNGICTQCSPGFYSNVSNASSCLSCPEGTFSANYASTQCYECFPGYKSLDGNTTRSYCVACAAGTFSNSTGSSECFPCPPGTQSSFNEGSTSCVPSGSTTGQPNQSVPSASSRNDPLWLLVIVTLILAILHN